MSLVPSGRPIGRRGVLAGAAGLAAGALTGCSGGSTLGHRSSDQLAMMNDNGNWKPGYQAAGEVLRKLTGYGFDVNSITNNYNQIVKMSIQTRKIADVVKWQSGYPLAELVRSGRLTPLDDVWTELIARHWVDESLRSFFTVDGATYSVPLYRSHFAFFYSIPAFDRYGLSVPSTWEDFLGNAETLKGHGVTPFGAQYADWQPMCWFEELVSKTDPEFYAALCNDRAAYTDPTMIDILRLWSSFAAKGWFSALDLDIASDCGPMLKKGTLGMVPFGTWISGGYEAVGVKLGTDVGLFNLPPIRSGAKPTVVVESGGFTLPREAPNHDAAMRVIGDWLDPAVQRPWSDYLEDTSANPGVEVKNPAVTQLGRQLKATGATPIQRFYESSPPALIQTVLSDLSAFMLAPTTITETATQMAQHAREAWTDWNLS